MLPDRTVLDENVEKNYEEMFKGIKLSKKAEKKVKELLSNTIGLTYKLKGAINLHNRNTEVHNAMVEVFNHRFEYPQTEELADETENQETTQESIDS